MADVPANVPYIYEDSRNSRVRAAMTFGSGLESGWSGTATNPSGATGWYQILLPVHPDITFQQAEDPGQATSYMLPSYISAVRQVPDHLWVKDPELAAEQAVILAERPGGPFPTDQVGPYGGEGTDVVNQRWQQTADMLTGQWKPGHDVKLPPPGGQKATFTSAKKSSGGSGPASWWDTIKAGLEGGLSVIPGLPQFSGLSAIQNFLADPIDALERGALIVFGAIIVIVGLITLTRSTSTGQKLESATVGAATRGLGTRVGGAASGASADRQRRLALAESANEIGERKVALKEKREARLENTAAIRARPAVGRHRKPTTTPAEKPAGKHRKPE